MLYERFWQWLTRYKQRTYEHEYVKTGESSHMISYSLYYYNHFKCSECGKTKKSINAEKSHRSSDYMYF